MISIVLYGRNDNYGYNLHKRAALSLNCMSEMLADDDDEIIFVDYNTPDDFPTFPEAILDTLTEKTRGRLRIFRARSPIHERFRSKTRLLALESVARNIGVRRSNPSNRWILSTNTDIIFVAKRAVSLNEIVRDLPKTFYHTPRLEIPESLWESLDRRNPGHAIDAVREWGQALYLNEIVFGPDIVLYDGPGDFQLIERRDLFENQGFNEEMLLGWHVDSNIAKRLGLIYGKVGDLGDEVYAYHCDHTRQMTPLHSPTRTENDLRHFVHAVIRPDLPQQAASWGCPDDEIEEVPVKTDPSQVYITGLRQVIGMPMEKPIFSNPATARLIYDPRHVLPFLVDLFCAYPKTANIAWYGAWSDPLQAFAHLWRALRFSGSILVDRTFAANFGLLLPLGARSATTDELLSQATGFVFDFGAPADKLTHDGTRLDRVTEEALISNFKRVADAERERLAKKQPLRRMVAVNAINNRYERFVRNHVGVGLTPFSSRIRHGFVLPPFQAKQNWLPALETGEAGVRVGTDIESVRDRCGDVAFGPYRHLDAGWYRIRIDLETQLHEDGRSEDLPCVLIKVVSHRDLLAVFPITRKHLSGTVREFFFEVPESVAANFECAIETRIQIISPVALTLHSLTVERADESEAAVAASALDRIDRLPLLHLGPAGKADEIGVRADKGREGYVVYGPYYPLPAGRYQVIAALETLETVAWGERKQSIGTMDVAAADGGEVLSATAFSPRTLAKGQLRLTFEVPASGVGLPPLIETRVWSAGKTLFRIRSMEIVPIA